MKEQWVAIKGYEGLYEVSSFGNVRSVDRILRCGRHQPGKLLHACGDPYLHVSLAKDGHSKTAAVHILVAQAYVPNPFELPCVNHKDENKKNNAMDNLEWCTYGYNNNYSDIVQKSAAARRGKHLSTEHKQRLSMVLKQSGADRAKKRKQTMMQKYPDGYTLTEETKKKISASLLGVPKSEETRQKMKKPKSDAAKRNMSAAQKRAWKKRRDRWDI